jgi:predicted glycoside hydrolase/deacetylase ChbG (UPF0249 family)
MRNKLKRELIINADDFGMHTAINIAVETAFTRGFLTSASLCANGEASQQAFDISKKNPELGVGIHFTLNGEKPVAEVEKTYSLVDENGYLFEDNVNMFLNILKGKIRLDHIYNECEAQILKFLDNGLIPSHFDSHRHVHLIPQVFATINSLLYKYKIKCVRTLKIPFFDIHLSFKHFLFLAISRRTQIFISKHFKNPDYFLGYFNSDNINTTYIKSIIPKIKYGVTEINFHPGSDNISLNNRYGFWKKQHNWFIDWEQQFHILYNNEIRDTIYDHKIKLITYRNLYEQG